MREDMNKYNTDYSQIPTRRAEGEISKSAGATAKTIGGMVVKSIKTLIWICAITGVLVMLSVFAFILSYRNTEPPSISDMKLNYSSVIYLDDEDGNSTEYYTIYRDENRAWVDLADIPQYMKTAQIAIEDHRFEEHSGVDWKGTLGAVYGLVGGGGRGGSTLTQQLIKNITGENKASIMRKIKEVFTALNLEGGYTDSLGNEHVGYSKEEILQAYLNVVNYGGQCQGVQAAANCYFDKDISECSLAECALIAGITQNPYKYNPLIFPENAKERALVVLERMYDLSSQGLLVSKLGLTTPITLEEFNTAKAELDTMTFVGAEIEEEESAADKQDQEKWNWYIDTLFNDLIEDYMEKTGCKYSVAEDMIYHGGWEIHCAMDVDLQNDIENLFLTNTEMLPEDEAIKLGFYMMDPYTGRIMAVVGNRGKRTGTLLLNNATGDGGMGRQSGSAIKPITVYSVGLNEGVINYGTVLKDEPLPDESEYLGFEWPQNYDRTYDGTMNVDRAIEESQNAPAAWLCKEVTPQACYDWLVNKLHFTSLTEEDSESIAAMALGGQTYGVYLEEMVAAYQIYANGGVYHEPFSYYYVKDHDGNVILDNRAEANPGEQVMSVENATIMNKLLQKPIYGSYGTATYYLSDLDTQMYGKTGTTDDNYDLWFIGATPFAVMGMWNGYELNDELQDSTTVKVTIRAVVQYLLDNYDWSGKEWVLSDNVVQATFCRDSGKIAGPNCLDTATGWYESGKLPGTCNGGTDHISGKNNSPSPSTSPSPSPSVSPSPSPSPSVSPEPSVSPDVSPDATIEPTPGESSMPSESEPAESEPTVEPAPAPTEDPTPEPSTPSVPDIWGDTPTDGWLEPPVE